MQKLDAAVDLQWKVLLQVIGLHERPVVEQAELQDEALELAEALAWVPVVAQVAGQAEEQVEVQVEKQAEVQAEELEQVEVLAVGQHEKSAAQRPEAQAEVRA